jgi:uncharacterized protein YtpQ (UPF0354 family)
MFWTKRMVLALPSFLSIGAWFKKSLAASRRTFADIRDLRIAIIEILARGPGVTSAIPDASDPARIIARANGRDHTIDLTNLFNRIRASTNEDPDQLIAEFTSSFFDMGNRSVSEANLVVVLRDKAYVDYISTGEPGALTEAFVGELSIVYMADSPGSMLVLSPKLFPAKNLTELHEIVFTNVRKWLGNVKSDDHLKVATLYFVEGNTLLSPTLILLDEFWKSISERYPGDVLIAVPRRDQLFIFNDDPQARTIARRLIDLTFRDGFSLLSDKIFARRNGKIVMLDG